MFTNHSSLICCHLNDWPHLKVVSIQSSVRFRGSFRHPATLWAAIRKKLCLEVNAGKSYQMRSEKLGSITDYEKICPSSAVRNFHVYLVTILTAVTYAPSLLPSVDVWRSRTRKLAGGTSRTKPASYETKTR